MQIREIGIDLPPGFYAQLPKLAAEPFSSLARVFGAIWSLLAPTDSHIDFEGLAAIWSPTNPGRRSPSASRPAAEWRSLHPCFGLGSAGDRGTG